MIGGAITPIVATALFGAYGSSTPIAIYVTVLCLVSLAAVIAIQVHPTDPATETAPSVSDPATG
jgi:hypothetical protein